MTKEQVISLLRRDDVIYEDDHGVLVGGAVVGLRTWRKRGLFKRTCTSINRGPVYGFCTGVQVYVGLLKLMDIAKQRG